MLTVHLLQPMGTLDAREDGPDGWLDLRPVFQSDGNQPLTYELVGDAHRALVEATIEQGTLRWRHLPDCHGSADLTVRARGQVDGTTATNNAPLRNGKGNKG